MVSWRKSGFIVLAALLISLTGCSQGVQTPDQHDPARTSVAQPGSSGATRTRDLSFRITSAGTPQWLSGVVFINGKFYAVGRKNTLAMSTDGVSWIARQTVPGGLLDWLNSLAYGNGVWVATGGGARGGSTIITSVDGASWKLQPFDDDRPLGRVIFMDGRFFLNAKGGVYTGTDGVNWSLYAKEPFMTMAAGRGHRVWVGSRQTAVSKDGTTWQAQPLPTGTHLTAVAFGGGQFVAVGEDGLVMTSLDGEHWTRQDTGTNAFLADIASDGTRFVAVGEKGTILTSENGVAWKAATSGVSVRLASVTYGAGHFVAVGDDGTVLVGD